MTKAKTASGSKRSRRPPATAKPRLHPFAVAPFFNPNTLVKAISAVAERSKQGRVRWWRKTGRRTLLNEKMRQQIVASIRLGAYLWVAAAAAGIDPRTLLYWLQKGRDGIEPYIQLFHEVEEAQGFARLSAETRVHRDDPKFWLRVGPGRERPDRPGWTEEARIEHSGPDGGPIEHDIKLDDDDLLKVAKLAADLDLLGDSGEASADPAS